MEKNKGGEVREARKSGRCRGWGRRGEGGRGRRGG